MATPINKILSNQTQEFSTDELANISASLRDILGQGGGGGGGGSQYFVGTDLKIDENNVISVNTNGNANNDTENKRNFVEGSWTLASGYNCHAEGVATSALGYGVHAQGMWTCFSSNDGQLNGGSYGPIYWGEGAGATVEGYCNATTATPFSGTPGELDYGPIHGGILKVIGNGHVENENHETDVHVLYPSDALIIYRDGSINVAGKISANGVELGAGGGTVVQSDLMWKPTVGSDGYVRWTLASSATTPEAAYISGAQGPAGANGTNGKDGYSVSLQSVTDEDGGKKVTLSWGETPETSSFVIPSGAKGADGQDGHDGKDGTSVIVKSIREFNDTVGTHTKGGTEVTLEWTENDTVKTSAFSAFNGENGQDGTGTSLTASSGININNNLINVELGDNLKFDNYSNVTTEDNISVSSVRAGYYDNTYTIVNKNGVESRFISSPNVDIMTLTTHGLNNTSSGGNRIITADYDLNHLFFKSYDNNGTYSGVYSQVEVKVLQETAPAETQHRSSIALTDYYGGVEHTGLITVEKIAQWDQGGSFTGVTTTGSISGDGLTNPLGLVTSAEQALAAVGVKVDKPATSFVDKYLALRTDNSGDVSGWVDLKDNFYSKSEATGTFVATANIDATTLSGNGKSANTKLGVNTDVIATKDYVNSSFLPTSGGTVSGQLVVSGGSNFDQDNLKIIRAGQNGYGRIGLASNGALAVKVDDNNSNTTQINVAANASYNELIQVQHGGTTAYLIPAQVHQGSYTPTSDDGILHIVIES